MRNREFVKASISDFDETMNLIPAAILALPGYGWSAGSAKNWVDWENKKYHQEVGQVVLDGTQPYTGTVIGSNTCYMFFEVADSGSVPDNSTVDDSIISDSLLASSISIFYYSGSPGIVRKSYNGSTNDIAVSLGVSSGITTRDEFLAYMAVHPLTVNYGLATPIETDISALIDDNAIEVESGGSLTFENTNGDSYRIPVPSSVVTMEKP